MVSHLGESRGFRKSGIGERLEGNHYRQKWR